MTASARWAAEQHAEAVAKVVSVLCRSRLAMETEKRMQADMAERFADAGLVFEREVAVAGGIIDFLVQDRLSAGIGIEVKIGGRQADIVRQITGYAADPRIASFVLATSKPYALPTRIAGKRITTVHLGRAWL